MGFALGTLLGSSLHGEAAGAVLNVDVGSTQLAVIALVTFATSLPFVFWMLRLLEIVKRPDPVPVPIPVSRHGRRS